MAGWRQPPPRPSSLILVNGKPAGLNAVCKLVVRTDHLLKMALVRGNLPVLTTLDDLGNSPVFVRFQVEVKDHPVAFVGFHSDRTPSGHKWLIFPAHVAFISSYGKLLRHN